MYIDVILFRAINNFALQWRALDVFAIFFAEHLIFLMVVAAAIFCWLQKDRIKTYAVVFGGTTVAYLVNIFIGILYFRPRPFVALEQVQQLIEKSALEKSFPSGHATAAFALAFAVLLYDKRWGWCFLVAAVLVVLGRVYVGVHYPIDILGGLTLGAISAFIARKIAYRPTH